MWIMAAPVFLLTYATALGGEKGKVASPVAVAKGVAGGKIETPA
ncbi:hypothetical protein JCM15764A_11320 [Geotalea toluenoxydans]